MNVQADEIIFSKRRTLAIEVKVDGRLIVRAPKGTSQKRIQSFLNEKADWIGQAQKRAAKRRSQKPALVFEDGARLPLFAVWHHLRVVPKVKGGLVFVPVEGFRMQEDAVGLARSLLVKVYWEQVRKTVSEIVVKQGGYWGLKANGIRITSAATRWGSCSAKNTLNFSYKLALLPLDLVEYVVVHELAHIRHHNHSSAFWKLVGEMMPDYQVRRARLKALASSLPEV